MTTKSDILDYLRQHKPQLLAQYHLSKIGIFDRANLEAAIQT